MFVFVLYLSRLDFTRELMSRFIEFNFQGRPLRCLITVPEQNFQFLHHAVHLVERVPVLARLFAFNILANDVLNLFDASGVVQ